MFIISGTNVSLMLRLALIVATVLPITAIIVFSPLCKQSCVYVMYVPKRNHLICFYLYFIFLPYSSLFTFSSPFLAISSSQRWSMIFPTLFSHLNYYTKHYAEHFPHFSASHTYAHQDIL